LLNRAGIFADAINEQKLGFDFNDYFYQQLQYISYGYQTSMEPMF
jgi:hypothetical protein